MDKIQRAILMAATYHSGQYRKDEICGAKLPYITHPLEVLKTLHLWGVSDEDTRVAAVLHDTFEDCEAEQDKDELINIFGKRAIDIVSELTLIHDRSLPTDKWREMKKSYIESFLTSSKEALIIKMADRVCNITDFLNTNIIYAAKYYEQSKRLFEIWDKRKDFSINHHVTADIDIQGFIKECNEIFSA